MELKGNKIRAGFGEAYRMPLPLFSSHLEETISLTNAKKVDGRTTFVPIVFELGRRYPLFKEPDSIINLIRKYDAENPKCPEYDFVEHQLELILYQTSKDGISVRLFNMDDGSCALALGYKDNQWMVESFNFSIDKEDAPGLSTAIMKILAKSDKDFFT